jgi:hypothetical protein
MKKQLFYWLAIRNIKFDRSMKKKLFIGASVLGLFLFVGVGIFAYIGFKTTSYLISQVPSQEKLEMITRSVSERAENTVQTVISSHCLIEMRSLLSIDTWLQKPIAENTRRISSACWGSSEPLG